MSKILWIPIFLGIAASWNTSNAQTKSDFPLLDMRISETPIDSAALDAIKNAAVRGQEILGVDQADSAMSILSAMNEFIIVLQESDTEYDSWKDISIPLGSLWGQQLVNEMDWEWATVTHQDYEDSSALGVVSPDRSLAIYPLHFIFGCIENNAQVKILLSYNMLLDKNSIPDLPANSYENVMDNIQFVIPPGFWN